MDIGRDMLDRYLEGDLSPDEFHALAAWINADPTCAIAFARHIALHAHLHTYLEQGAEPFAEHDDGATQGVVRSAAVTAMRRPVLVSWTVAALLIGLLVTAMALVQVPFVRQVAMPRLEDDSTKTVAKITGMNNVRWAQGDAGPRLHSFVLDGQELALETGLIELTFHQGAAAVVAGPARLRVTSDNGMHLAEGHMAAKVPPAATGFLVETEAARFVDLGTEFTVGIDPAQNAALFVRVGRVAYEAVAEGPQVVVSAGEGVVIGRGGELRRVDSEPPGAARLAQGIQRSDLIANGSFEDVTASTANENGPAGWQQVGSKSLPWRMERKGDRVNRYVEFPGKTRGGAALAQSIETTPGTEYVLTYLLARWSKRNFKPTILATVTGEGEETPLLEVSTSIDWPNGEWRLQRHHFVATSTRTIVRFAEPAVRSDNGAPRLDAVSVVVAPELQSEE